MHVYNTSQHIRVDTSPLTCLHICAAKRLRCRSKRRKASRTKPRNLLEAYTRNELEHTHVYKRRQASTYLVRRPAFVPRKTRKKLKETEGKPMSQRERGQVERRRKRERKEERERMCLFVRMQHAYPFTHTAQHGGHHADRYTFRCILKIVRASIKPTTSSVEPSG